MALPVRQAVGALQSDIIGITLVWPAHAADDIGVIVLETADEVVTLPGGWAEITGSPQGGASSPLGSSTRLTLFWKRATSGAEANVSIADPGDHVVGAIITFRGCAKIGDPWNITSSGFEATQDATLVASGATTTVADCLVAIFATHGADTAAGVYSAWANADLAAVSEWAEGGTISGNGGGFAIATGEKAVAGAYGNTTASLTGNSAKGWMTVAFMPPGAAPMSFQRLGRGAGW